MAQTTLGPIDSVWDRLRRQVTQFAAPIRRSVLLMITASGIALLLFSALVLPRLGLQTTAGLLTISGFNVSVIGLGGYFIYRILDSRY